MIEGSLTASHAWAASVQANLDTGQIKPPLGSAFALFTKELIWRYLIRFRPSKTPICLYASRRSGSTLMMQVISVNRGIMFSDQPFGLYTASSANINRLPLFPYGQLACPDAEEERLLYSYVDGVLAGCIRANIPWKFWSRDFRFFNDRICLKITDAKAMIDWIDDHFEVQTLVSTRHPVAQALSVSAKGWLTTGKGLLRNAGYVERWLSNELETYCWDIYRSGSDLERRIADWSLENLPALTMLPGKPHWLYVSYEDLLIHTSAVVQYLCDQLNLSDSRAMIAQVDKPSRSTTRESSRETRQLIQDKQRHRLLNGWREKVGDSELNACFQVLERFGIDLYHSNSSMPSHGILGRTGFDSLDKPARGTSR